MNKKNNIPIIQPGQTFGRLTALYQVLSNDSGSGEKWHCVCTCGRETDVTPYDLIRGHTRSCGCLVTENKDLTDQRFGRLVALYPTEMRKHGKVVWHCRCDCGNEVDCSSTMLRTGASMSCGCSRQGENLTGKQFNQWTVLRRAERAKYWVCRCTCGIEKEVRGCNLTGGTSKSCGCMARAVSKQRLREPEDLTGKVFDNWTVIGKASRPDYWLCRCSCGIEKEVSGNSLKRGGSKSCGCLRRTVKDYTGEKRGGLTAIEPTGKRMKKSPEYIWRCECGFEVTLPAILVPSGGVRRCPKCLARRRRDLAEQMLEKRKGVLIQNVEPGSLQNIKDGVLHSNNKSGVRGVYKDKRSGLWVASGNALGKRWYLGMYADIRDAANARKSFIEEWYGDAFQILEERKREKQPSQPGDGKTQ